jgi:hypothetical protein
MLEMHKHFVNAFRRICACITFFTTAAEPALLALLLQLYYKYVLEMQTHFVNPFRRICAPIYRRCFTAALLLLYCT